MISARWRSRQLCCQCNCNIEFVGPCFRKTWQLNVKNLSRTTVSRSRPFSLLRRRIYSVELAAQVRIITTTTWSIARGNADVVGIGPCLELSQTKTFCMETHIRNSLRHGGTCLVRAL